MTIEASSPELIERVRTTNTYTITYTLTGFSTVKRDDVELQTGVTLTLNADMRVGLKALPASRRRRQKRVKGARIPSRPDGADAHRA